MPTQAKRTSSHLSVGGVTLHILQSLPVCALAAAAVYACGYWKMTPLLSILVWALFQHRNQKRMENRFKQEISKAVALRDARMLVISNVNPLPPWIYFTDTERCEWLNKIASDIWPSFRPFVLEQIVKLTPKINNALSKYMSNLNFAFNTVDLGSLTPRVSGVRVYDKSKSSERIIVDFHVVFASDSVISCSIMNNIKFGCDRFDIRGSLRVVISTPNVSLYPGVEVFFLTQPEIGINLTGILNVVDVSGLSGLVQSHFNDLISQTLVLPNKFIINYDERIDFDRLKFPNPEGLLRVDIMEARALGRESRGFFQTCIPDSYVTVNFGPKTFTSPVVENTADPQWNFTVDFMVHCFYDGEVTVTIYDRKGGKTIGKTVFSLKVFEDKPVFDAWMQLEGPITGMVRVYAKYFQTEVNPYWSTAKISQTVLEVLVDDVTNLATKLKFIVAHVSVGKDTQTSRQVTTSNPHFGEVFVFTVKDPKSTKLRINFTSDENVLGRVSLNLNMLLEADNMEVLNNKVVIKGADESAKLSLSMRLRSLKAFES